MRYLIDDTGLIVGKINTNNYKVSKDVILTIQTTENLNYLWDIAQELNNNRQLSNQKLKQISNDLYKIKQRFNKAKLGKVKEELIRAINRR